MTTSSNNKKIFGIIMAGGSGKRFWPLSRVGHPKQLLALSGDKSLLALTVKRLEGMMPIENILVFTSRSQVAPVYDELRPLGMERENIIGEPVGRDTAACVGYAAEVVRKRARDGVMVVLPSDHVIEPLDKFQIAMEKAVQAAKKKNRLVTIGVKPLEPATGYGYIKKKKPLRNIEGGFSVEAFIEKPDEARAKQFVEDGNYYWNCGIFVWRATSILSELEKHMPRLYKGLEKIYSVLGAEGSDKIIENEFDRFERMSVDYGIMEKAEDVVVIEVDFNWDDVGSWRALERHFPHNEAGNVFRGDVVAMETANCTVLSQGRHLVSLIGCKDLIVVHTDDATLVIPKEDAEKVKELVGRLEEEQRDEFL